MYFLLINDCGSRMHQAAIGFCIGRRPPKRWSPDPVGVRWISVQKGALHNLDIEGLNAIVSMLND